MPSFYFPELQPVCRDELGFYQRIATSTHQDDVTLKALMPAFHGAQSVPGPDGKGECKWDKTVEHPKDNPDNFFLMEFYQCLNCLLILTKDVLIWSHRWSALVIGGPDMGSKASMCCRHQNRPYCPLPWKGCCKFVLLTFHQRVSVYSSVVRYSVWHILPTPKVSIVYYID